MSEQNGFEYLDIANIVVGEKHREIDVDTVKSLEDSIRAIGLQHPITVRKVGDQYHLIAGRHRLEACRNLGRTGIDCTIADMTDNKARLWEISENLHRAELSVVDECNQIGEWVRLTSEQSKVTQVASPGGRQPIEAGKRKAARELGLSQAKVQRAVKIAGITEEAKIAAQRAGLDKQAHLLEIAKAKPEEQVAKVDQLRDSYHRKKRRDRNRAARKRAATSQVWPMVRDGITNLKDLPSVLECIPIIRAMDKAKLVDQHLVAVCNWLQQLLEHYTRGAEQPTADSVGAKGGDMTARGHR
jgi:hypothetical protein